jgi:hypothetical protein
VKVHLAAALLEDESVSFLWKQFADYASKWRNRRRAHLGATPLFAALAEFDGHGVEGVSDGLFERLVFLAGRLGLAARERDDDERLGDVGQLFVVEIFREGDSSMDQILMPLLEVCHAGLNLTFPAGSHLDVSTFNCQLHPVSCLVHLVCSVCLVSLVCFVYLVDLVHLLSFVQPKNLINQIDQMDQMDQINQTYRASPNLTVPNWFFRSPLVVDISKRCAVL